MHPLKIFVHNFLEQQHQEMKKTSLISSEAMPATAAPGRGFFAVSATGAVFCFRPTSFWVRR